MLIEENASLRRLNTFGIDATARYFARFETAQQLEEILSTQKTSYPLPLTSTLILGGGSNILFTKNFNGLLLKNEITGIVNVGEDNEYVYLRVGGGVNWHQFVLYCIDKGLAGVENLSLIPGCCGASPIQNIGAYGVEIKDLFHELEAFHLEEKTILRFNTNDCAFGYRESVFKNKFKGQFAILSVTYKLRKQPVFHTSYGAIQQELEKAGVTELSIKAISDAVIRIRQSKLPDPAVVGNAGSFFKNPTVSGEKFPELKSKYPNIPGYPQPDGTTKLAAGWLIEQCGWKGFREGDAGVHPLQALVLVNYGNAQGEQIFQLSSRILQSVQEKFGVELEREVNLV
ncbi:MAG: UDP-N-acetylmuramate dehydrogenase [Bacteroidota bacterium]|nr:UDP-N-acetylmuramate dehydrogenase [Bacteroidota bacterium]